MNAVISTVDPYVWIEEQRDDYVETLPGALIDVLMAAAGKFTAFAISVATAPSGR